MFSEIQIVCVWTSCVLIACRCSHITDQYTTTTLRVISNKKSRDSMNLNIRTVKEQLFAVPLLIWIIFGLLLLICFACSLLMAFCIVHRHLRRYKKETQTNSTKNSVHLDDNLPSTTNTTLQLRPSAATNSMSIINYNRNESASTLVPLSRSKSASALQRAPYLHNSPSISPKKQPLVPTRSTSYKTNRNQADQQYIGRSRANTLPLNRANTLPLNRNTSPRYSYHLSPRMPPNNSYNPHLVPMKLNAVPLQKRRLEAIPSQKESESPQIIYKRPEHEADLPPIPDMNRCRSLPQMHAVHQMNSKVSPSPQYNGYYMRQITNRVSAPSPAAAQHVHNGNVQLVITSPPVAPVQQPPQQQTHSVAKHLAINMMASSYKKKTVQNVQNVVDKTEAGGVYLDVDKRGDSPMSMTDDTVTTFCGTVIIREDAEDEESDGIVGMLPNMFGKDDSSEASTLSDGSYIE